jgi:hypothetical protein
LLTLWGRTGHVFSHDCGELGSLAQSRRRYLLVARHRDQVPEFLYKPPTQRIRGVGEVLSTLPVPYPGQTEGGPLHKLDGLCALNWVRLACISAGKDWKVLPEQVAVSQRAGRQNGGWGVNDWEEPSHTVVAAASPGNCWLSTTDPRLTCEPRTGNYGVRGWKEASVTVIGQARIDTRAWAVADPRSTCARRDGAMGVRAWDEHSITVIAHGSMHNGPWQVGDVRVGDGDADLARPTHELIEIDPPTIVGETMLDLSDKRPVHLVIRAADGTWHRPFTTLELLALQGFPVKFTDGSWVDLDGRNKRDKRAHRKRRAAAGRPRHRQDLPGHARGVRKGDVPDERVRRLGCLSGPRAGLLAVRAWPCDLEEFASSAAKHARQSPWGASRLRWRVGHDETRTREPLASSEDAGAAASEVRDNTGVFFGLVSELPEAVWRTESQRRTSLMVAGAVPSRGHQG